MRTTIYKFLFATAFLLFACQLTGIATPPAPTNTPESILPPTITSITPNTYVNEENGITVRYPKGWITKEPDPETQSLIMFTSPDSSVVAFLYIFPLQSNETLESVAADLSQGFAADLQGATILSDGATSLDDGTPAWVTVISAKRSDGSSLKINLTTTIRGARIFTIIAFGTFDAYDFYQEDITTLTLGMHPEAPSLYGIPRDQALVLAGSESTNPRDYDPATTHSAGDKMVFSGLVSFDTQLNIVPELAETWDISTDGTVYIFKLRENARFHDGRPVTAQDVIYSWERAANPETQSDTVLTYLGDIVGVREMYEGQADHISGLKALDDDTLEVTIDAPKPYFLLKLTYPTAFVVDRYNVESGAEWYRTPNGTGPYRLIKWERFSVIVLERNEDYYLGLPAIPYVVIRLYSGIGIRLYEAGEIDITNVYYYDVPRVLDPEDPLHDDLQAGVDLCTYYVVFDVTQPPFEDVKVRQAFSMAFDRQKYIDVVRQGIGLPAEGLYPPGLPGYNTSLEGLSYNPERARQLLAESKYGSPGGLPTIVFTDAGMSNDANASVAAMAQMWEQNLGVTITIENLDPDKYYDLVFSGHHGQMFDSGWCADYPDPENFADVLFHSGAQHNLGNYSNPEVDAILDQARIEQDVTRRIQLYQQAEQMIINDAPALFIMHSLSHVLVKPYVQGFVLTPIDIPLARYLWLDWEK